MAILLESNLISDLYLISDLTTETASLVTESSLVSEIITEINLNINLIEDSNLLGSITTSILMECFMSEFSTLWSEIVAYSMPTFNTKLFQSVNFSSTDVVNTSIERTLIQFRNSPVFINVLSALVSEIQVLSDTIRDVINKRGPADAEGYNLDVIGRIVGQERIVFNYSLLNWFTPDQLGTSCDQAPAWVTGAPLGANGVAGDPWYRQLILARVLRNFTKYGSIPELQAVAWAAFQTNISFQLIDMMKVKVILPSTAPSYLFNIIDYFWDSLIGDQLSLLPYPSTLEIEGTITLSSDNLLIHLRTLSTILGTLT